MNDTEIALIAEAQPRVTWVKDGRSYRGLHGVEMAFLKRDGEWRLTDAGMAKVLIEAGMEICPNYRKEFTHKILWSWDVGYLNEGQPWSYVTHKDPYIAIAMARLAQLQSEQATTG